MIESLIIGKYNGLQNRSIENFGRINIFTSSDDNVLTKQDFSEMLFQFSCTTVYKNGIFEIADEQIQTDLLFIPDYEPLYWLMFTSDTIFCVTDKHSISIPMDKNKKYCFFGINQTEVERLIVDPVNRYEKFQLIPFTNMFTGVTGDNEKINKVLCKIKDNSIHIAEDDININLCLHRSLQRSKDTISKYWIVKGKLPEYAAYVPVFSSLPLVVNKKLGYVITDYIDPEENDSTNIIQKSKVDLDWEYLMPTAIYHLEKILNCQIDQRQLKNLSKHAVITRLYQILLITLATTFVSSENNEAVIIIDYPEMFLSSIVFARFLISLFSIVSVSPTVQLFLNTYNFSKDQILKEVFGNKSNIVPFASNIAFVDI